MAMQPKKKGGAPKKSGRRKSQLSPEELKTLKEAYGFFDKNGDGEVDVEEIGMVLKSLGLEISKQELEDIMADLDENGDGHMDFDEFVTMMDRRMSVNSQRQEIRDTFKVFDKDNDNFISFEDLKEALQSLGEQVSDKDVKDMIKEADKNGDGKIDFQEFMMMMMANEDEATKSSLFSA